MFVTFGAAGDVNMTFPFGTEKKVSIKMTVRRYLFVADRADTLYPGPWDGITVRTAVDCTGLVFSVKTFINTGYYVFARIKV